MNTAVVARDEVLAARAPRPNGVEAQRIERAVAVATVIQLVASVAAPALVIAVGRPEWVLPSIAITTGVTSGALLLATAVAGFHDLATSRQRDTRS